MKLTCKVLESNADITKFILEDIKKQIDIAINKSIPSISQEIKNLVAEALRSQPEYASLMTGTLKAEFGIFSSSSIQSVINGLIETLQVTKDSIKISNNGLSGGFKLTMMKSDDLNGLIYADFASVIDDDGYVLPWLQWLLLEGQSIIVKNYEVLYTKSASSRSGMALMQPSKSSWKVPAQFSGTEKNNWTTRAINSIEDNIYAIIQKNIEKYL
jgi:hypothetical protein